MRLGRLLFRLRPEEAAALVFVLPTTWLTLAAYFYAREAGVLGPRYLGGVWRLGVVIVLLAGLALALRRFPGSRLVQNLREGGIWRLTWRGTPEPTMTREAG